MKLSEREHAVLFAMCDNLPSEYAAPFKSIATYVESSGGECEAGNIRRVVRSLARKGYVELIRGLFSDDGYLNGSGYGPTREGRTWFKANGGY